MKKSLLFIFFVLLGVSLMAQKQSVNYAKAERMPARTPDVIKPYVKSDPLAGPVNRDADIVVGTTKYDVQSYGGTPRHVWAWEDGTVGIVWTMGMETGSGYPDRGTGYNYFDGSTWGPIPTTRIENDRTGWSEISSYGSNGEIVCAHAYPAGTILFSYRENKGEGEWQYFQLTSPVSDAELVWPRMVVTGDDHKTVHVLCMVGWNNYEYEGLTMALTYSRTTDGGQTWDPYMEILDGMTSDDYPGVGADIYGWAVPHGDTLAFVVFDGIRDGFIMKSENAGETWEKKTFYQSPYPFFTGDEGNLPRCGGGDGANAIAIDDDGMVHVAFGRQVHIDDQPDDGTYSFYPYTDGLVYWNESMPPLDTSDITNVILTNDWTTLPLYQHGQLAAYTHLTGDDSIHGIGAYYTSLTAMPQIEISGNEKEGKIVSIFYSGVAVGFVNEETERNYRHIFKVYSELDGKWSEPEDLTGDVFHLASECVFPSSMQQNGKVHLTYQTDNVPGLAGFSEHDALVNNIVYLPVSPLPVGMEEHQKTDLEVTQNYPNPVHDRTAVVVQCPAGPVTITVINTLGQQVYQATSVSKGQGVSFELDLSGQSRGVYFYTVNFGGQKVTKKMMVE